MYPCNTEVLRWQYVALTEYQCTNVCIQHWVLLHIQSTCLRRSLLKQDQGQKTVGTAVGCSTNDSLGQSYVGEH